MGLAATLYTEDRAERRTVELDATLRNPDRVPVDAEINDLSVTGFRARCDADLALGAEVSIGLAGIGVQRAHVVRRDGNSYGCEFVVPLGLHAIERALDADTVVAAPFVPLPTPTPSPEPEVTPLPFVARIGVIVGLSGALWAGIFFAAAKLVA